MGRSSAASTGTCRATHSLVAVGQTVTRGQQLGLVGSTGQSTGPHLHFGIQIGDTLIDPLPWLTQHVNSLIADSKTFQGYFPTFLA